MTVYDCSLIPPKISTLAVMAELLFECYNVPSIAYGVDCLFSYQHNNSPPDGLIISIGYHTTHIIPIIDGRADTANSRRINVGGYHITSYMHRLLQLKYPVHVNAITLSRAEVKFFLISLLFNHVTNYFLFRSWSIIILQWPFITKRILSSGQIQSIMILIYWEFSYPILLQQPRLVFQLSNKRKEKRN